MTTLAEARAELAKIAERQAALQKIVDAAPKSLLIKGSAYAIAAEMKFDWIDDRATRNAYADALDTLLMLRYQPGTEAPLESDFRNTAQWVIGTREGALHAYHFSMMDSKLTQISPCFTTEDDAQAAIDTIGTDRILRMFRTLHGVA